jgi:hypothetical protein
MCAENIILSRGTGISSYVESDDSASLRVPEKYRLIIPECHSNIIKKNKEDTHRVQCAQCCTIIRILYFSARSRNDVKTNVQLKIHDRAERPRYESATSRR